MILGYDALQTLREQALSQARISFAVCVLLIQASVLTKQTTQKWTDAAFALAFLVWSVLSLVVANNTWLLRRCAWIRDYSLRVGFHGIAGISAIVVWVNGLASVVKADLGVLFFYSVYGLGMIVIVLFIVSYRHFTRS